MVSEKTIEEALAKRLDLHALTEAERSEIMGELLEALTQRILFETTLALSEEDQEIFLQKLEDDDMTQDQMDSFLAEAIPDYSTFLQKHIDAFFTDLEEFEGALEDTHVEDSVKSA